MHKKTKIPKSLPQYLTQYIVDQNYEQYTEKEHAIWRHIMKQSKIYFSKFAHKSYLEGLIRTGLCIDKIPKVEDMNSKLSEFGWGAVCIRGFIPPLAFLDFQSRNILPIAADIRSLENITYTPSPDIVHEAAGHAPIIANESYRKYLEKYAQVARKAIYSKQDIINYEAIRELSDLKENHQHKKKDLLNAEKKVAETNKNITWVSEANEVARLYWWTVEYGLVKTLGENALYGAGLLSSIEESRTCLSEKIRKIPLSLDCIKQSYDITKKQPQLYVADNFTQLIDLLEQYEKTMCYLNGGLKSTLKAQKSEAVTTTILNSNLGISGVLNQVLTDKNKKIIFLKWQGPVQLSEEENEIPGHGTSYHKQGFSTPIGKWSITKTPPSIVDDRFLFENNMQKNNHYHLKFESGFSVKGTLKSWKRSRNSKLMLMSWKNCTVSYKQIIYFEPSWGIFDMAVGEKVDSVYGGPANYETYEKKVLSPPTRLSVVKEKTNKKDRKYLNMYKELAMKRQVFESTKDKKDKIIEQVVEKFKKTELIDWLLCHDLAELIQNHTTEAKNKKVFIEEIVLHAVNVLKDDKQAFYQLKKSLKLLDISI